MMAKRGAIPKKGAGGLIESLGQKAVRGYLKEATEGVPVKKIPTSKFDRLRAQEERAYEKGHGLTDEERRTDPPEDFGEYDRNAHGLSLEDTEALDDMNTKKEMRRKTRAETKPTPIRGQDSNLEKELIEKGLKGKYGQKRGGRIDLGSVSGSKAKRRMDKKGRR